MFYILVYLTLFVLEILLWAYCRCIDFVIKIMQTHLENLKILIKQC